MDECICGEINGIAGEHSAPSTCADLDVEAGGGAGDESAGGAGDVRPDGGLHLGAGPLLLLLRLILQPDRAFTPPGGIRLVRVIPQN